MLVLVGILLSFLVFETLQGGRSGVGLSVGQALHGVGLHLGRVHWVVGLALELEAVAQVHLHVLLLLREERVRARPCVATHHNHAENLFGRGRVGGGVLGHVAVVSDGPGGCVTLYLVVLSDGFESGLLRVLAHSLFHKVLGFDAFGRFLLHEGNAVAIQNRFGVVDPVTGIAHLLDGWHGDGTLLGNVLFDLGGRLLLHSEHALGHEGRAQGNAGDLGAQQELFVLVEEGVSDDSALEVTREVELDLSCDRDVLRRKVRQQSPLVLAWAVTNPVGELVGARVSGLDVGGCAFNGLGGFCDTLNNVVAALSTGDLTPESKFGGTGGLGEVLHGLLEEHRNMLAEVNVSPLVNSLVILNEVGHVANGGGIICSTLLLCLFSLGIDFL